MAKSKAGAYLFFAVLIMANPAFGKDDFDFLPDSGQELILKVMEKCKTCDPWETVAAAKKTEGEWKTYLTGKGALQGLKAPEVKELTNYLAINFPMPKAQISKSPKAGSIPTGGRSLLLDHCMGCHLVTLPVISEHKTEVGWSQLFTHADHAIVAGAMSATNLKTLSAYLTNNFPISEEKIPKALREPAPQY